MRQIKFRAKSECAGEGWVFGDLGHINQNPRTERMVMFNPKTGLGTDIVEETIGQFTGICDKEGKDIYEGDIVEIDDDVVRCFEIEKFGAVTFQFGAFYCGRTHIRSTLEFICSFDQVFRGKVIGNKYDNPELLKETE